MTIEMVRHRSKQLSKHDEFRCCMYFRTNGSLSLSLAHTHTHTHTRTHTHTHAHTHTHTHTHTHNYLLLRIICRNVQPAEMVIQVDGGKVLQQQVNSHLHFVICLQTVLITLCAYTVHSESTTNTALFHAGKKQAISKDNGRI